MSGKSEVAYQAVLQFIKVVLLPTAQIKLVMSDFEAALRNSVVEVFPTAHSTGCNVHFDRVGILQFIITS